MNAPTFASSASLRARVASTSSRAEICRESDQLGCSMPDIHRSSIHDRLLMIHRPRRCAARCRRGSHGARRWVRRRRCVDGLPRIRPSDTMGGSRGTQHAFARHPMAVVDARRCRSRTPRGKDAQYSIGSMASRWLRNAACEVAEVSCRRPLGEVRQPSASRFGEHDRQRGEAVEHTG